MKKTSMILGIIGGVAGLLGAAFAFFAGGLVAAFGGGGDIATASLIAVGLSILGIVGAAMVNQNHRTSGYMMLVAGIDGLIAISAGYFIAGPLFIIAGILALKSAKKAKDPFNKKNLIIWIVVGVVVVIILMMNYSSEGVSQEGTGSVVTGDGQVTTDNTKKDKNACPDITQVASKYDFKWAESDAGHNTLYLYADFILDMNFSDDYKLANKPDLSEYLRDYVVCKKGEESGESIKKLYCKPIYVYEPMLEKQNIDSDGNIISTDTKYIKAFIFDIDGKDIENVNDLNSLKLEGITCSDSWL